MKNLIKIFSKVTSTIIKKPTNLSLLLLLVSLLGAPTQILATTSNIDTTTLVGATAGSFSVNQGIANYNIPITVPTGAGGVQPELNINYSSDSGNGLLGIGFSLGGLSTIHRCAKNIAIDGVRGRVRFDENDRYCLDGQRLIVISGEYGQSGSEYRTEINNFSKITYNGNSWNVQTKSGQTFEYGNTDDSRIEVQGKDVVQSWAVNKILDVVGNAVIYTYFEDNDKGEYRLIRINYADNRIELNYENRADSASIYQLGTKASLTQRLQNIKTYAGEQLVRSYHLTYQQQDARNLSYLNALQECVNGQCLPKTILTYSENNYHFQAKAHLDDAQQWQPDLGDDWKNRPMHEGGKHSLLVDMNGDGLPDRVLDRNPTDNQQGLYVFLNKGNAFDEGKQWQADLGDDWLNHPNHTDKQSTYSLLTDMNGDGLTDRIFDRNPSNDQQGFYVFLNTGNGFDAGLQWQSDLGDNWMNRPTHTDKDTTYVMLVDMNADGLPDRVFDRNPANNQQGLYVFLNTGNGFDAGSQWQSDLGDDWMNRPTHADKETTHSTLMDMNGDGLPDRILDRNSANNQQGFYVYLNTGSGFDAGSQWQSDLGDDWKNRPTHADKGDVYSQLVDINGDGLPDRVLDRNPTDNQQGLYVFLNTGNGFDAGSQWQADLGDDWKNRINHYNGEHSMLIDINGDGLPDRVFDRNPTDNTQGLYVFLNTGDGFDTGKQWQTDLGDDWRNRPIHEGGEHSMLVDMNGDGLPDRVFDRAFSYNGKQGFYVLLNKAIHAKLTIISNGFSIVTHINYKALLYNELVCSWCAVKTSPLIYQADADAVHPNIDTNNAHQVVASVITDNAIGGQNTTSYQYGGAKANLKGRGNLGFRWIEIKDEQSNKLTRTEFNQNYPFIGQVSKNPEIY